MFCNKLVLSLANYYTFAIHILEDCYVLLILKNWHKYIIWNHNLDVLYNSLKMNLVADFSMPVFKTVNKYTQCHVTLLFVQVYIFTMFNNACVFIERHWMYNHFFSKCYKEEMHENRLQYKLEVKKQGSSISGCEDLQIGRDAGFKNFRKPTHTQKYMN